MAPGWTTDAIGMGNEQLCTAMALQVAAASGLGLMCHLIRLIAPLGILRYFDEALIMMHSGNRGRLAGHAIDHQALDLLCRAGAGQALEDARQIMADELEGAAAVGKRPQSRCELLKFCPHLFAKAISRRSQLAKTPSLTERAAFQTDAAALTGNRQGCRTMARGLEPTRLQAKVLSKTQRVLLCAMRLKVAA